MVELYLHSPYMPSWHAEGHLSMHYTNVTCQVTMIHSFLLLSSSHMVQDHREAELLRQSRTSLCVKEAEGSLTCSQKPLLPPTETLYGPVDSCSQFHMLIL
jgi:hypothetical protein